MARHATVSIPAKTWTELTAGDAQVVTIELLEPGVMFLAPSTGGAPHNLEGVFQLKAEKGRSQVDLTEMFGGMEGATRLWAWSKTGTRACVSHSLMAATSVSGRKKPKRSK